MIPHIPHSIMCTELPGGRNGASRVRSCTLIQSGQIFDQDQLTKLGTNMMQLDRPRKGYKWCSDLLGLTHRIDWPECNCTGLVFVGGLVTNIVTPSEVVSDKPTMTVCEQGV